MSKTRKAICLLPIGLLCAVFIYPFLHELGHGLVVFLLGAKVVELQWFPLPSILCRMNSIDATEYVVAGMGGIIFPAALCLLIRCNRKFWIWYAVFIVRLICIWSLLLSAISIVLFKFGILLPNDDMTQILQIYPQQWWVCGVLIVVMCLSLCISVAKSKPIHKRKDGRWEARYKCGISVDGKTLYKSVYAKTYAEVKEKQQKCMVEYRKGAIPERCVTFGSALALWQEVNKSRHKRATNMRYANLIDRHIAPELSNIRISQINTARLSDFMNRKLESGRLDGKGGLSPAYVRSIMLVINSVIEFSIAECLCPPVKINIHMPAMQRKELEILNSSDQARLETALLADLDETSLGIYLTLQTGLRIGEVCALRWCDIDLARAIIHIRSTIARVRAANNEVCRKTKLIRDTPKTKASTRDIPIAENVLEALKVVKRKCRSEYVISPTAEFVSPRTFEYRFHKFLTENNIPDVNYHVLRHTFATRCVEAGVDIKSLSELLGHSNVAITLNTYVHSSIERKREELKKLNHMA